MKAHEGKELYPHSRTHNSSERRCFTGGRPYNNVNTAKHFSLYLAVSALIGEFSVRDLSRVNFIYIARDHKS